MGSLGASSSLRGSEQRAPSLEFHRIVAGRDTEGQEKEAKKEGKFAKAG